MFTRVALIPALVALALSSTSMAAAADRKCTPVYNNVFMAGTNIAWVDTPSLEACRALCVADAKCAAFSFLGKASCYTVSDVTSETYNPEAQSVASRCMDASSTRLLLLPREYADYPGLDVGSANAANPTECGYKCQDTPGCNAYSWTNYNGGSCWMKSAKPDVVKGPTDGTVVSGEVYTCQRPRFDADAVGADVGNVKRPKWTDCCSVCRRTSGCGGFSWSDYNGGTCWLKGKITGFTDNAGVTAAVV